MLEKSAKGIAVEIIRFSLIWFGLWFLASFASLFHSGPYDVTLHTTFAFFIVLVSRTIVGVFNEIVENRKNKLDPN